MCWSKLTHICYYTLKLVLDGEKWYMIKSQPPSGVQTSDSGQNQEFNEGQKRSVTSNRALIGHFKLIQLCKNEQAAWEKMRNITAN